MKPLLTRRAKSLTKAQLKNKLATDQTFYELYLAGYNTKRTSYGADAFEGVLPGDVSKFQVVPISQWEKAHKIFKYVTGEYEQF